MGLNEQLAQLEVHLQGLNHKVRMLQQENLSLRETQQFLKAQCEELFGKNELAKKKIEQILSQLTNMDIQHD